MVTVKRRVEADLRSVKGQKERMTIAAEMRELNPGGPRKRTREGGTRGEERAKDRVRRGTEVRERKGVNLSSRPDQLAHSDPLRSDREPRRKEESRRERDGR